MMPRLSVGHMTNLPGIQRWLDTQLPALAAKYEVPAAAVAVYAKGEVIDVATGVLSLSSRVDATTDSIFQIGSITKLWTATLVMQLTDDGLLDIDLPLRQYLPEFHIKDASAAESITTRQLLSHTAGFEGDIFTDTGKNDDAIEKLLRELVDVPQLFEPGEQFSYNNAGYSVLGRLVEVLRGKPYAACLKEHLFTPLGLSHAAADVGEAILFRAAVGHIRPEPEAELVPAPIWSMSSSNAPAGSQLAMRARDLMTFARMQLNGGVADDGTVVLSPESAAAMRERQVELPDLGLLGNAWGLGWEIYDTPGGEIIGHDGSTIGQNAFLRITPDQDAAVVILTNGGDSFALYHDIAGHVLTELAGFSLPALPKPPAEPQKFDASRFVGVYSAQVVDMEVTQGEDGRIWATQRPKGELVEMGEETQTSELVWYRGDSLIPVEPQQGMYLPHVFLGDDGSGRARYLHIGRALRRSDVPV